MKPIKPETLIVSLICAWLVIASVIIACTPTYEPLDTTCTEGVKSFNVVLYEDRFQLAAAYRQYRPETPISDKVFGFHLRGVDSGFVELHLIPPRGKTDYQAFRSWGHELAHVVCGDWHPPDEAHD